MSGTFKFSSPKDALAVCSQIQLRRAPVVASPASGETCEETHRSLRLARPARWGRIASPLASWISIRAEL